MAKREPDKDCITDRASALPRRKICPASKAQSDNKLDFSDSYSMLGRAFHDVMAAAVHGRDEVPLLEISAKHACDPAELMGLFQRFTFDPSFGAVEVAVRVVDFDRNVRIRGRLDHVEEDSAEGEGAWHLTDYKTTHRIEEDPEPAYDPQTQAYAVGFLEGTEGATSVNIQKAYVRRGDNGWSSPFRVDAANLDLLRNELIDIVVAAELQKALPIVKRDYALSSHCSYCPGRIDCPAISHEVSCALNSLTKVGRKTILGIEAEYGNVSDFIITARLLERGSKALKAAAREFIESAGPVEAADGKFLATKTYSSNARVSDSNILKAAEATGVGIEAAGKLLDYIDTLAPSFSTKLDFYKEGALAD